MYRNRPAFSHVSFWSRTLKVYAQQHKRKIHSRRNIQSNLISTKGRSNVCCHNSTNTQLHNYVQLICSRNCLQNVTKKLSGRSAGKRRVCLCIPSDTGLKLSARAYTSFLRHSLLSYIKEGISSQKGTQVPIYNSIVVLP